MEPKIDSRIPRPDPPPASPQERLFQLELEAAQKRRDEAQASRIGRRTGGQRNVPLSFSQERLWFLDQMGLSGAAYNVPLLARLSGPLNEEALQQSFGILVRRHASLRTRFAVQDGVPYQLNDPPDQFNVSRIDLRNLDPVEHERQLQELMQREHQHQFDLGRESLFRVVLVLQGSAENALLVTLHHTIVDGWSLDIMFRELVTVYEAHLRNQSPILSDLEVDYADYALWQRQRLRGDFLQRQLNFWRDQLNGAPPQLQLPTDRPRPPVESFRGSTFSFILPTALRQRLDTFARSEGATPFMLDLAAFQLLLSRYSGNLDVVVGSPIEARTTQEVEGLIGSFVNTLALRTKISPQNSFRDLLRQVKKTTLGALSHQDLPFELLVKELQPERELTRQPIVQVMLAPQNYSQEPLQSGDLTWTWSRCDHDRAHVDLTLYISRTADTVSGVFEYATDLFKPETIARMAEQWCTLLESIVSQPDARVDTLSLLTHAERTRVLLKLNATGAPYPKDKGVHELFYEQVERTPHACALVEDSAALTYGELNERAERLKHQLKRFGVCPEAIVGIHMERSAAMVVAFLAVLKAGGAYMPLDPTFPPEHLAFMLRESGVSVVISTRAYAPIQSKTLRHVVPIESLFIPIDRGEDTPYSNGVNNLAYVLYTSGSTGLPKAVGVSHGNIIRLLIGTDYISIRSSDVFAHMAAPAFDASTFEIWGALLHGGKVVIYPDREPDLGRLDALFRSNQVSVAWVTAGLFHQILEERPRTFDSLRYLLSGGDVLSVNHVRRALKELPDCRIIDGYGPTEATTFSACHPILNGDSIGATVPIGRPIANTTTYVLDSHLQPLPTGIPGELYIGGDGIARGYLNRPDLTATKFVADPFGPPGRRLYRTGDRVRWRHDGRLEFLGRLDHQVKIRGYRIEPAEVEEVLLQHALVKQVAVVTQGTDTADRRLVAYIVPDLDASEDRGEETVLSELRTYIRGRLPRFMTPSAWVLLDRIPLTANGKVDRRALPARQSRSDPSRTYLAPQTPLQQTLVDIWEILLQTSGIGIHENFFDLGGHSLLATRVVSRIRERLKLDLPVKALFESPTIEQLSASIESSAREGASLVRLVPQPRNGPLPLSFAQERLWFLDRLGLVGTAYNIPLALRIEGALDTTTLEHTLAALIIRHECLRTRFSSQDGIPHQLIAPLGQFSLPCVDLTTIESRQSREAELQRETQRELLRRFDLSEGPLFRVCLFRMSLHEHVLLMTLHHIVSDGWSLNILSHDLYALYTAFSEHKPCTLPELPVQYVDYAIWQRQCFTPEVIDAQLGYWRARLHDAPPQLRLPSDRARPEAESFRGGIVSLTIPEPLAVFLHQLAQQGGATLFMVILAAYNVLLYRWSGADDIVVGSPVAARTNRAVEGLIGFFVNTMAIRTRLSGELTFAQLLQSVKDEALGAYSHLDLPFARLVEALNPDRSLSHQPIFQVMLALQDDTEENMDAAGLTWTWTTLEYATAHFDLTLYVHQKKDRLRLQFEYAADLFDRNTIERLATRFQKLLETVVAQPQTRLGSLSILLDSERDQLLNDYIGTRSTPSAPRTVTEMFSAQVQYSPDTVAVLYDNSALTYRELNDRSTRLAHYLNCNGVGADQPVAICIDRRQEMVIGVLAILKSGGAYLPLDPAYPVERIRHMVKDAAPRFVLVGRQQTAEFPQTDTKIIVLDDLSGEFPAETSLDASWNAHKAPEPTLAYVIYTSGSTGRPKGTAMSHSSMSNLIEWHREVFGERKPCHVLQFAPLSFDVAFQEIFSTLCTQGTLVLLQEQVRRDAEALVELLQKHLVQRLFMPPLMLQNVAEFLADVPEVPSALTDIIVAGEQLRISPEVRAFFTRIPKARLHNHYGPTETHVVTALSLSGSSEQWPATPAIGRPVTNAEVYVLDVSLELLPIGVEGEICIGGDALARGYLQRPELTALRFVANPFSKGAETRLYRTGDLGRWREDGTLEYSGRNDNQIKIRGYRIELGEIESQLERHENVKDVAVIVREDVAGDKRLVAYVTLHENQALSVDSLLVYLDSVLPEYMVPSAVVVLDRLPLSPNGKLDRKVLPAPSQGAFRLKEHQPPQGEIENAIATVWRELLKLETVGRTDNFFQLGGHSLLATRVLARIRDRLGIELPLRRIFDSPTILQLAAAIEDETRSAAGAHDKSHGNGPTNGYQDVDEMSDEEVLVEIAALEAAAAQNSNSMVGTGPDMRDGAET